MMQVVIVVVQELDLIIASLAQGVDRIVKDIVSQNEAAERVLKSALENYKVQYFCGQ